MIIFTTIMVIILISLLILLAFTFYMFRRNEKVYEYHGELLKKIKNKTDEDIEQGKEWRWRLEYFDTISYNKMVFKFWKPLDSFYKDTKFIE